MPETAAAGNQDATADAPETGSQASPPIGRSGGRTDMREAAGKTGGTGIDAQANGRGEAVKIISGGQCGADIAGLKVAKRFGIPTGGWMPLGWLTLDGPRPEYAELYGMQEFQEKGYKPRTWANVRDSDGTVRIATNFESNGERCTANAIRRFSKPSLDIDPTKSSPAALGLAIGIFIHQNHIEVLNVAGNTEETSPGIFNKACWILKATLEDLGYTLS